MKLKEIIYRTNSWSGYKNKSSYWNEYEQDGKIVRKFKCSKFKFFDGKENNWEKERKLVDEWKISDSKIPSWIKKYLK